MVLRTGFHLQLHGRLSNFGSILRTFWSKGACGTESNALLISKNTEHISVCYRELVNSHERKTVAKAAV